MSEKRDYYEVLGVERTASAEELRRRISVRALKHHPDRNPRCVRRVEVQGVQRGVSGPSDDQAPDLRSVRSRGPRGRRWHGRRRVGRVRTHAGPSRRCSRAASASGAAAVVASSGAAATLRFARLSLREAAFGLKREITVNAPTKCEDCGGRALRARSPRRAVTVAAAVMSRTRAAS